MISFWNALQAFIRSAGISLRVNTCHGWGDFSILTKGTWPRAGCPCFMSAAISLSVSIQNNAIPRYALSKSSWATPRYRFVTA